MTVNGYEDEDDVEGDDVEGDDVEVVDVVDVVDEEGSLSAIWRGVFACAIGPYNRL